MKLEQFDLERIQSLYENEVDYNLTESGVHPYTLRELLLPEQHQALLDTRLTYGQTNGLPQLRDLIANLYQGLGVDNILVTNGSSEANFIACTTLLETGDEVVMVLPNYMQIHGLAQMMGVVVKPVHLEEATGWRLDMDALRAAVSPQTRMIVLCNPNNPTGAVLTREEMQEMVSLADSVGAWVYCDEVYRGAELDGREIDSFIGLYDKVLVTGGLSKAYALPGLRLGWLAGPEKEIEQAWATSDYTSITAGVLSNQVAIWALESEKRQEILARNRALLRRNLEAYTEWCNRHGDLFRFVPPKAGGFAFTRYHLDMDSNTLARRLREEKSVFVVPGSWFGLDHFIRLGLGSETDYLVPALEHFSTALAQWRQEAGS